MSTIATFDDDFDTDGASLVTSPEEAAAARSQLSQRCMAANLPCEITEPQDGSVRFKLGMKCGRDKRWLNLWSVESVRQLLSIEFEKYTFLSDLNAICSYEERTIEAGIHTVSNGFISSSYPLRRIFGHTSAEFDSSDARLQASSPGEQLPGIEISVASDVYSKLVNDRSRTFTLKLSGCQAGTHDSALALLIKISGSIFFQLDLITEIPLTLTKERRRSSRPRPRFRRGNRPTDLSYPKTRFDEAPLSLYWYGRSATRMPLLQFLAFYQVLEFYFPIYSRAEAQRRLKTILKDPSFRGDRDTDIARLLSAIHINRTGDVR